MTSTTFWTVSAPPWTSTRRAKTEIGERRTPTQVRPGTQHRWSYERYLSSHKNSHKNSRVFWSKNLSDRSCFSPTQRCSSSRLFRRSGRAFSSLFFRIASLFISRCDSRSSPLSYPGVIALRSLFGASLGPTGMATSLRRQMAARSS